MSSVLDLPDWQVYAQPVGVPGFQLSIAAGNTVDLFNSPKPFRIWSVWLTLSCVTSSTYAGGNTPFGAQIQDNQGLVYARCQVFVDQPNQPVNQAIALSFPGVVVPVIAGVAKISLITDAAVVQLFSRASAGAYASV